MSVVAFDPLAARPEELPNFCAGWAAYDTKVVMRVRFYWGEVPDVEATRRRLGLKPGEISDKPIDKPIMKTVAFLEKRLLNEKTILVRPATPEDTAAHPLEWAEFQKQGRPKQEPVLILPPHPAVQQPKPKLRMHIDGTVERLD